MEEELKCPACSDIFKNPVILPCSHSLCQACVQQRKTQGDQSCPVCTTDFSSIDPILNLALSNACQNFSRVIVRSEAICNLHNEPFKLFCLNHEELVCLICRDSGLHAGHKFRPIDEAANDHEGKLQDCLQNMREKLKDYNAIRNDCIAQAVYMKVQKERVERQIIKDFKELRLFLQVEEEARLSAVRGEVKTKSDMLKRKNASLVKEITALSSIIKSTEENLMSGNISLLKNFKGTMSKTQKLPSKPKPLHGILLDEAKHVGNLKFTVWEGMKKIISYSPVILDLNTAGRELNISEDLTSLSFEARDERRPNTPERMLDHCSVLGSALDSGKHVWDVDVGDNQWWQVGVALGDRSLPQDMSMWTFGFSDGKYKKDVVRSGIWKSSTKISRIQVCVDMKKKTVSFTDFNTHTKLCKTNPSNWPSLSKWIKVYPFFSTKDNCPLKIISKERFVF